MSIQLNVTNKALPASTLQGHIIQGENNAASVQITLPIEQSGVSLLGYEWEMRGTLEESNALAIASLQKQEATENITLTWLISSDFTGEDGPLQLMLVGIKDGEDIFKFKGDKLTVVANVEGTYTPEANYFESVLTEIRNLVAQAQAAAENAPVVGDNGNWFYYNAETGQYDIDSGESARGVPGIEGPQGPPGIGLTVMDYFGSLSDLEQMIINPSPGDVYGIGTSVPYDIYVYSETQGWVNNGPIQGPPGQDGIDGHNPTQQEILDMIFPVGAIYFSSVSANPSTYLGGTWERIAEGRMLIGVNTNDTDFNEAGKTGGTKETALPLSNRGAAQLVTGQSAVISNITSAPGSWAASYSSALARSSSAQQANSSTPLMGTTDTGNIMNPYETAYIWKRTA